MEKIKLGIRTCLLGENVRYDGGHKLDRILTDTLGQYVEYAPVCPDFKKQLSSDEKQELLEVVDYYRQEYIPLVVTTTLINHYVRKYDLPYLKQQVYLNPYPLELQLRNHV